MEPILSKSDSAFLSHAKLYFSLMERCAREPSLSPQPMLARLLSLMQRSHICHLGDWSTGYALLGAARALLHAQPSCAIIEDLGGILMIVWADYGDADIRDLG